MMYTLPELPYAYNALEPYIDAATMQIHHDKHHAAYVKNVNDALASLSQFNNTTIQQLMTQLAQVPEDVRMKVRNNGGGHYNHTLFWTVMAPNISGELRVPSERFATVMDAAFGSLEKFQEQFSAAAMARFGSGWVWLVVDARKLVIMDTPNQDNPLMAVKTPILGLDVWEHAYYLKYQNVRADYVKAWWNVVHWAEVERRYKEAVQS
ncbi:MAG: superoxide dismutase [Candidatus Gottesmanbacteria bacterium]|nr:superoxide dismutase [Candidatus Gottesmanbacteria bacterium]